ncbi:MAG: thymidine phosphorylase, partial [Yaniella sp.]|nr:thymidine phosphorylase [Yaniella sp.]
SKLDARAVGEAAWHLGAGRQYQGQAVQATAGIRLHAKPGDTVTAGEPLFSLFTETPERFAAAEQILQHATDTADVFNPPQLIADVIR